MGGESIFDAWAPPAWPGQMSPPKGHLCGHPLLKSVLHYYSVYMQWVTTWCLARCNILLNLTLHFVKVTMMDLCHFQQFLPFSLGLKGQSTPVVLLTTRWHNIVFILGTENMIYKLLSNRIAHWKSLTVAKMGFCHFLLFFVFWGYILNPCISNSSFYHLNLNPTPLGINLKTVLIPWKFFR